MLRQQGWTSYPQFTGLTEGRCVYTFRIVIGGSDNRFWNDGMSDPKPLSFFEWNDQKRLNNIEKHGIDFEDALLALQEPRVEFQSLRNGEVRTLAICPDTNRIITVVYTMRGEICRIISARPAHKNEQRIYNQSFAR